VQTFFTVYPYPPSLSRSHFFPASVAGISFILMPAILSFLPVHIVDEEVDKDALLCLNELLLTSMFPKLGVRAKFMAKLAELKDQVSCTHIIPSMSRRTERRQKAESLVLSCFRCDKQCAGWHSLYLHFRVFHNLTNMSNFVCGQGGCPRDCLCVLCRFFSPARCLCASFPVLLSNLPMCRFFSPTRCLCASLPVLLCV